jgi:Tfp pilus assembly ATPase PilU
MDIGYFLKLMTEKNASDMFLTTGAPVYIKIEGSSIRWATLACRRAWSRRSPTR